MAEVDDIVCTVSTTTQDGTVVRWYRSEIAAEHGPRGAIASASRNGFEVHQRLTDGEMVPGITARAVLVYELLRRRPDADLSGWATHRWVLGFLERVKQPAGARHG
jgi:hypothetical protein